MTGDFHRHATHPKSPVQDGKSSAHYLIAAAVAAIVALAVHSRWASDIAPLFERSEISADRPVEPTRPLSRRGDIRTVFAADDYPVSAMARNEQGSVRARLQIDVQGRVSDCTITQSSGYRSLDNATCRILRRRARFNPARDPEGSPVTSSIDTPPVTWRLAD